MTLKLFRQEVFEEKKVQNLGPLFINNPVYYGYFTMVLGFLTISLFLFIGLVPFSDKTIALGILNSTKGVVSVYPNSNGIITKIFIKQGDKVHQGDPLFLIDTKYEFQTLYWKFLEKLEQRKKSILDELKYENNKFDQLKPLLNKNYISKDQFYRLKTTIHQLENSFNQIEMEILKEKQERFQWIMAPVAGRIAILNVYKGQHVQGTMALLKILPAKSKLQAEIFVPIKEAGFLEKEKEVMIHYDAYPHNHFGSFKGRIQSIDLSPSIDGEKDFPKIGQPYYKVIAMLEKQYLYHNGKKKKLQQGMSFSCVILGHKQPIAAWIFSPIFKFKGGHWL